MALKTYKDLEEILLTYDDAWLEFPFGKEKSVYKVGEKQTKEGEMFALIENESNPIRLSLRCDPALCTKLREVYETVMPAFNLNKKYWNTLIMTGQVPDDELISLIAISYNLAKNSETNRLPR